MPNVDDGPIVEFVTAGSVWFGLPVVAASVFEVEIGAGEVNADIMLAQSFAFSPKFTMISFSPKLAKHGCSLRALRAVKRNQFCAVRNQGKISTVFPDADAIVECRTRIVQSRPTVQSMGKPGAGCLEMAESRMAAMYQVGGERHPRGIGVPSATLEAPPPEQHLSVGLNTETPGSTKTLSRSVEKPGAPKPKRDAGELNERGLE